MVEATGMENFVNFVHGGRWVFDMMLAQAVLGSEAHLAMLDRYKAALIRKRLMR